MLPGFRFLLGAIVLCFSILVFGLGAAALFRAAHEEFASRPSWRATPGTMLAQQNEPFALQSDPSRTVLALLEVEPDDPEAARDASRDSAQEPALQPLESEATAAVAEPSPGNPVDAAKLRAPEEPLPVAASDPAKDGPATPEPVMMASLEPGMSPSTGAATVARAAAPAAANVPETPPIASLDETASKTVEPTTATSAPTNVPAVGPETIPTPKLAALGSPEAADTQAREREASSEVRAKAYRNFIKKRLRAQRAAKARRRLAHRARIVVRRAAVEQRPTVQQQPTAAFATAPGPTNFSPMENPHRF